MRSSWRSAAALLVAAFAGAACGRGAPAAHPGTDAAAGADAGAPGDDGGGGAAGNDAAGDSTTLPPPLAHCGDAGTTVTPAPADTDTPPTATGPYLWKNVAIVAGGFVSGIVFSPAQRDVIYARTDIGGAYRWNAAAGRWIPLVDWVSRANANWSGIESIAADPMNANNVYIAAGTYVTSGSGVILRSNDQGRTFAVTTTSIPMGGNNDGRSVGERLVVDPNQPSTLYFGSRASGIWKSTDAAVTFNQVGSPPGLASGRSGPLTTPNGVGLAFLTLDPARCGSAGQTSLYAGVAVAGTSLFVSGDGGGTWSAVAGQPTGFLPSHAAVSATGKLYVTYGGGTGVNGDGPNNVTTGAVFRLDLAAGVWTDITPIVPSAAIPFGYAGVSVDAAHPDTVVVSTLDRWIVGDDVYRSTDAGATWTAVGIPGAPHDVSAAPWVTFHQSKPDYTGWMSDVEIDPFAPDHVLHVTGQGIWASDDLTAVDTGADAHWDFRSVGIEETAVLDLASPPSGPPLLSALGDIGGFRHDDLDVASPTGMASNPVFTNTDGIDFAEANPAIVARVGRTQTGDPPHGAFSIDGGSTWTPFPTGLSIPTSSAGSIAVSADGATFIWDTPANTAGTPPSPGGPQVSRDQGMTWTPSAGIGAIRPVVADRVNPSKFYAFDTTGRFYRSVDGGMTFAVTATGLPTGAGRPRLPPGIEGDVWLVTRQGLRHSIDSGTSFATVASASAVVALGFGKAAAGASYPALYLIGTVNQVTGIFRSDDGGAGWTRLDDDQHLWPTATVITGDPRVYGRVYVGTNGRGILYGDIAP